MPLTYRDTQPWYDLENTPLSQIVTAILRNGYYPDVLSVREPDDETPIQEETVVAEYLTELFENHLTADSEFYQVQEDAYEEMCDRTDAAGWVLPLRPLNARDSSDITGEIYPLSQRGKDWDGEIDAFYLDVNGRQENLTTKNIIRILFLKNEHKETADYDWPAFVRTFPEITQTTLADMADDGPDYLDHPAVSEVFFRRLVNETPQEANPLKFIINYTYRSPNRVN